MTKEISDSQFYMWRALFALVHVDHIVSNEEVRFMAEALEDIPFSRVQRDILIEDIHTAQDVLEMFIKITDPLDQARFFEFAHDLVHIDGEYGIEEQKIMLKLEEIHVRRTNVDDLIGHVNLQFEDEEGKGDGAGSYQPQLPKRKNIKDITFSFREEFLKDL